MSNTEPTVNTSLAACLRRRNPRWAVGNAVVSQSTKVFAAAGLQPDVLVRTAGAPVVIEAEFEPAATLDGDALSRIGVVVKDDSTVVESVIAVVYPKSLREVPEGELEATLESADDLRWYIRRDPGRQDRVPATGWLVGGVDAIAGAIELLAVSPSQIDQAAETLEAAVSSAAGVLGQLTAGPRAAIARELHQEDGEQTRRMASAIIANAFLFQIAVSHNHGTPNIDQVRAAHPLCTLGKRQVLAAWHQILEVNYWPIFDIARKVLLPVPDDTAGQFCEVLAGGAQDLAGVGAIEVQDLAGQMFGQLIADRKFLATFYTLPESAALLAELAVARLDSRVDWSDGDAVTGLRIADLACGTGALLSAAYRRVAARVRRAGGDDAALHTAMMEHALIGADVMPAAAHLSTTMLSAAHPAVPFEQCGIHVVPYGAIPGGGAVKLGSLELFDAKGAPSLFGREATRLAGHGQQVSHEAPVFAVADNELDVCIMNPPFTRPTNHEIVDVPVPSFAGFDTPDAEQRLMSARLKKIQAELGGAQAAHGNAGLASNFLDLAHCKLKPGGVLALIVPAAITAGGGWVKARELIADQYDDVFIATLAEVAQGSPSRAFSADTGMAEAIVVATKKPSRQPTVNRRSDDREPGEGVQPEATYVTLRERPGELLEAVEIAGCCSAAARRLEAGTVERIGFGDQQVGWLAKMPFDAEPEGNPAGIARSELAVFAAWLRRGSVHLPRIEALALPVAPLDSVGARGPVHRDIDGTDRNTGKPRGPFDRSPVRRRGDFGQASYPVLWAHDNTVETTMTVLPDHEGTVRAGMDEAARRLWQGYKNNNGDQIAGATRLHVNLDFRINSQATAACCTPEPCIGGRAWPSFAPTAGETWENALCVWLNTTLGLIGRWWVSNRQQQGRANLTVTTVGSIPVPDLHSLDPARIERLASAFDDLETTPMLPANEAYHDQTRQELDHTALCGALGLPEDILEPLAVLRRQWCEEPSVHGGKSTRP